MGYRLRHRVEALGYALVLLLVPACCATRSAAQEVVGPSTFTEDEGGEYRLDVPLAEGERAFTFWVLPEPLWYRTRDGVPVVTGPPGRYTIRAHAIVGTTFEDARQVEAALAIQVTPRAGPTPDPGPPGPNPPTPGPPGPDWPPIKAKGLRVLILYESGRQTQVTRGHYAIFYGTAVRDYLNTVCVGQRDGWRLMDPDDPVVAADPVWAEALSRERGSLPWVVISNGTDGYEGPLPVDPAEFMKLVSRYGKD